MSLKPRIRLRAVLNAIRISAVQKISESPKILQAVSFAPRIKEAAIGLFVRFREFFDSFFASDLATLEVGKALNDAADLSDQQRLEVDKVLPDSLDSTDNIIFNTAKGFSEQSVLSDVSTYAFNKETSSLANFSENFQFDISKVIFDTVFSTDDLDGEASLEDESIILFNKERNELLFIGSETIKELSKDFANSSNIDDLTVLFLSKSSVAFTELNTTLFIK